MCQNANCKSQQHMQSKMEWKVERSTQQVKEDIIISRPRVKVFLNPSLRVNTYAGFDSSTLTIQREDIEVFWSSQDCDGSIRVDIRYKGEDSHYASREKLISLNQHMHVVAEMVSEFGQLVLQTIIKRLNPIKNSKTRQPLTVDDIDVLDQIDPSVIETRTRTVNKVRVWFRLPTLCNETYRDVLEARCGWNPKNFGWQDEDASLTDEALFEKYSKIAKDIIVKVNATQTPSIKQVEATPKDCDIYDIVSKTEVKLVSVTPTTTTTQTTPTPQ